MKTYSELMSLSTFKERFEYLRLKGTIGEDTFGGYRYLNQRFYMSPQWKSFRNKIIIRDLGCDLGIEDRPIFGSIYIHHIEPITKDDILNGNEILIDPENAICTSFVTHNAIHYGDDSKLFTEPITREPNDTCPWKRR